MGKKKIIAIVACALLACVILGVIINAAVMSTPKNTIENAVEKSFKAATKSDDAKFIDKVLNGGSIEISANAAKIMEGLGLEDATDMDISAKCYFDIAAIKMAFSFAATMKGDSLIDALVYMSDEKFAVSSEALLGKDAYGIVFKDIEKNFDSSEFGEDGEYSLGIDLEVINSFLTAMESMSEPPKELEKLLDKTSDIADDIYTMLIKSALKHSEVDKTSGTISCAGKDVKTKDLSIVLNGEAVSLILADAYDYFANDKSLNKYLTEDLVELAPALVDYFYGTAFVVAGVAMPDIDIPDVGWDDDDAVAYADDDDEADIDEDDMEELIEDAKAELIDSIETAVEQFYESLEDVDIDDQVEECADALEDFEANIVIHVGKKNGQIIGVDVSAELDGNDLVDVSVVCGPDWDEITEISVKAEVGGVKMSVSYEVSENTKKVYNADIKVKQGSDTIAKISISWDKKEGDLKVKASSNAFFGANEIVFKGNLKASSKEFTLMLDKLTVGEQKIDLYEITITVKTSDKMPEPGKVKDILTLSSDDFEEIKESIEEAITSLSEDLEDAFSGLISGGGDIDDIFGSGDYDDGVVPEETNTPDEDWDW